MPKMTGSHPKPTPVQATKRHILSNSDQGDEGGRNERAGLHGVAKVAP